MIAPVPNPMTEEELKAQDNGAILSLLEYNGEYAVIYNTFPYRSWKIDKERFDEWLQFMQPDPYIDEENGCVLWTVKNENDI